MAVSVENESKNAESLGAEMRLEFLQTLSEEETKEMRRVKAVLERKKEEILEINKNIFSVFKDFFNYFLNFILLIKLLNFSRLQKNLKNKN